MQTDAKVVPLNKGATQQSPTSPVGRLPVALIQVRDKVALQLKQTLQALFDNADDTLFEMADRATSNAEQNAFFEAMRDLRLKRKSIERTFLQKVSESFSSLNQYEVGKAPQRDAVSFDSLSLVQNDELEEAVALDAMVAKVMNHDGIALGHLTARFNTLVSKKIEDKSNPLGPRPLCEAFLDACRSLGVEIKVKLIILKLFEKYVLTELDQIYAEANQLLVTVGVLPDLRSAPARCQAERSSATGRQAQPGNAAGGGQVTEEGVQEIFGVLQDLLSQVRGTALPRREHPADAVPVSSLDLMRLLSHLQQHLPQQHNDDYDLRMSLDQLLTRASARSGRARVVGQVDDDVINLVSMLFEFILDDRTLPDSLKALIGRMQIPMLKVALLDKTFFSRGSHPARRLLNEIASAALGWVEQDEAQRDSLYHRIEQVVQRLLNDFVDDPAIFSELLAEFLAYAGDERRRSELLEQRTRDAEEGRAKAELARRQVEDALNQRLLGRTLPEVVVRLLQEAWSKVLLLSCLKHGVESAEWQSALQTMDDLIWSVESHDAPEARARLLELVPGLLKSLRDGLASAAFDPFSTSEFFSQLETLHVQAFQRFRKPEPVEVVADDGLESPPPLLDLPDDAEPEDESAPVMVAVVEEIVLVAPGEPQVQEPEVSLADDDEALGFVDSLRVGSWVEFQEDDEHKLRCKLAALIKPTGKYIFVNRTGMKVLEKTRMGLAVEFRRNAIRLLDDALLFDRALESVIGNLRRLKGA
ncbi:DUF1631 domain-containing protein [Pseudomonas resinovorans]|uniref:DUF1631 domain-containing protein n=1 Tax=Metapseudomonas resinovorans TaxID=53412 RepID=UPI00237EF0AE|nr:DUF1631 domain-containing protein [Pseudomonas resinovorans]MDE3738388.1 DUF1631 domain-containing protein [Pseudomonas resinovorans]